MLPSFFLCVETLRHTGPNGCGKSSLLRAGRFRIRGHVRKKKAESLFSGQNHCCLDPTRTAVQNSFHPNGVKCTITHNDSVYVARSGTFNSSNTETCWNEVTIRTRRQPHRVLAPCKQPVGTQRGIKEPCVRSRFALVASPPHTLTSRCVQTTPGPGSA